jgi:biopolymer transport protein ExbB
MEELNQVPENIENTTSSLATLSQFMQEGGIFMWIILSMWLVGLAIAIERVIKLKLYDTNAYALMISVKKNILLNNLNEAINICSQTKALLAYCLKSGLQRANQTKENIKDALESSLLESIPKTESKLAYIAMMANISTLIGLLGTIYGLIESFAAVASADPAEKSQLLALGISKAMNTTALGLISAITLMIIHQLLSSKAEKIQLDMEENSQKLVDLLNNRVAKPVNTSDAA